MECLDCGNTGFFKELLPPICGKCESLNVKKDGPKEHEAMSRYFRDELQPCCPNCSEFIDVSEAWKIPVDKVFEFDCPLCKKSFLLKAEETRVFTTGFPLSEEQKETSNKLWEMYQKENSQVLKK